MRSFVGGREVSCNEAFVRGESCAPYHEEQLAETWMTNREPVVFHQEKVILPLFQFLPALQKFRRGLQRREGLIHVGFMEMKLVRAPE